MLSGSNRRVCLSIGGPVSLAAHQVRATARVAERELRMPDHAKLVICEQSIERTNAWLTKRRGLRTRWSKKAENWLALIQLACAHVLLNLAVFG
jgi:hypothetical protein